MSIDTLHLLHYGSLALAGLACVFAAEAVLSVHMREFSVLGRRAGNRIKAAQETLFWSLLQPVVLAFTAYASHLRLPKLRAKIELYLRQADEPYGLVPSEVLGLSLLAGLSMFLLVGSWFSWWAGIPATALGLVLPYDKIRNMAHVRIRAVGRALPTITDLIVLGMEAGLDFVGAVKLLLAKTTTSDGKMPIRDELLTFMNQLQLGRTRRVALANMAQRVPADSVRSFTTAVIQAEEKGMPLRDVLRIQADVLRHKRVQEAEEYISNANLQMMAPITIIIMALLAVIVVPVLCTMDNALAGGG